MRNDRTCCKISFVAIIFIGCGTNTEKGREPKTSTVQIDRSKGVSTKLRETFKQEDLPVNDYLTEQLKPIRVNFKRINSISEWEAVYKKNLWESTEGGEAIFYFNDGQLEKITARQFGETFQLLTEYYLLKGQLSFALEKSYKYNRPILQDSTVMKEMNDTETFNFNESEIVENRSYFQNGKLIHQITSQDRGSPFSKDYLLEEQKRIKADFEKLIKLSTIN